MIDVSPSTQAASGLITGPGRNAGSLRKGQPDRRIRHPITGFRVVATTDPITRLHESDTAVPTRSEI